MNALMIAAFDAAARNETPAPVADARLSRACTSLATLGGLDVAPYPLISFALQSNGIIEPWSLLVALRDSVNRPVVDKIRPYLAPLLAAGFTRIGVGTGPRDPFGGATAVIALQANRLRTSPIPRFVKAGATFSFDVVLTDGDLEPTIAVTRPTGASEFIAIKRTSRDGFGVRLDCGTTNGRLQIQILASGRTLANFPVWCGVAPPKSLTFDTRLNDTPNDPAETEREILQRINRERKSSGRTALIWNEDLAQRARAHSQEMRKTGIVSEVLMKTDRARGHEPGVRVWTSVVRARGIGEIDHYLLRLPSLRIQILSSSTSQIGIGVAYKNLPTTGRELFVTALITSAGDL